MDGTIEACIKNLQADGVEAGQAVAGAMRAEAELQPQQIISDARAKEEQLIADAEARREFMAGAVSKGGS
ncbi:MAG: hypothetical protein ABII12_13165 [Planctomycetota bacterium]